jgi:hypothetical protein
VRGKVPGVTKTDWRLKRNRREAFQRSYTHSLRYRNFPGCVYFALPALAKLLDWDTEQRYLAAWLNANTQNPVTTCLLMQQASDWRDWEKIVGWQAQHWHELAWDTDRKYFKSARVFRAAMAGYAEIMEHAGSQRAYWAGCTEWDTAWAAMTALPYMGRLSAWSGLEYVRLLTDAPVPNATTLLLEDASGSRSHRNGLVLIAGYDDLVQDAQLNPGYSGKWEPDLVSELERLGESLLAEAYQRNRLDAPAGRLTLESALCTWKSWHKKNRRYPNVYADMFHDRIRRAESVHGPLDIFWDIRKAALPAHLRLEDTPGDPGLKPAKQNHYRLTGEVPLLGHEPEWPEMWSGFDQNVADGAYGRCR